LLAAIGILGLALVPVLPSSARQNGTPSNPASSAASSRDRWLHVRVTNSDSKGEVVRVNVPLDLAEKVLPAINKDRVHNGKVKIEESHIDDLDLRAIIEAVRTAKDGEFVTVQNNDQDVKVMKTGSYLAVHVRDKQDSKNSTVEIKVPMRVLEALFSAGKDELDLVAALHALSAQGDTEIVSVKDHESTVRVWLDSKNAGD
jgi:invasion protein IalB